MPSRLTADLDVMVGAGIERLNVLGGREVRTVGANDRLRTFGLHV
jgi:hypothetical protein